MVSDVGVLVLRAADGVEALPQVLLYVLDLHHPEQQVLRHFGAREEAENHWQVLSDVVRVHVGVAQLLLLLRRLDVALGHHHRIRPLGI